MSSKRYIILTLLLKAKMGHLTTLIHKYHRALELTSTVPEVMPTVALTTRATVPWKRSNPRIFVLERSRQIQNLLPKQRKISVNNVILHIEIIRRS